MTTNQPQYDNIASKYFETDFCASVENYTFRHLMLGPLLDEHGLLTGKRVLDLACGYGLYTRELKALNCAYILGVDISSEMIKLARDIELKDPKGIDYMVVNAKDVPLPEKPYDLVTACYLLCYARTRGELLEMVRMIYAQLGENKHFIGITDNVAGDRDVFDNRKYGVFKQVKIPLDEGPIPDGTEVFVTFYNKQDEPLCTVTNYHLSPRTYEQVFKEAGFRAFRWVPFQCDSNVPNKELYEDLIKSPNGIGIVATK
ncbi:unnamed protein product [Adineta steineri]|uniref:Methyltransferase domain-containing protein n=1 Tax=Adineta steineri TaxID=433720 RepID=A0A819Q8S3_9BILA|nr:unnamed protein product [Adineta steineri]CAF4024799.1 unnamed protein product [Adineta steineri]